MKASNITKVKTLLERIGEIDYLLRKLSLSQTQLSVSVYDGCSPASRGEYTTIWNGTAANVKEAISSALRSQRHKIREDLIILGVEIDS